MYITKETRWQLSCRCHDNSYAAGPVLITTKIPRFHLAQGSSTPNNLMGRGKTMWKPCLFRGRPPVPLKKVANGDIWFFTERDWNQGCCHSNNIVGVILFLMWCTFLVPSLKIIWFYQLSWQCKLVTVKRFESWRFKRYPFVGANQGIVGCVWFIYRKMELRYWLMPGNVKNNRIN